MNRLSVVATAALFALLVPTTSSYASAATQPPKAQWPARGTILRLPAIPWPNWKPGHRGIDIEMSLGDAVSSPVNGRVVWVGVVSHEPSISIVADGLKHTLVPVDSSLTKGDWVAAGESVGALTSSSHCGSRTCLHWSVRRGSDYLDPRWVAQPLLRRGSPR